MKKLFAASVFASLLAASSASAFGVSATQPIKSNGPDTLYAAVQPTKGTEGPDIRQTDDRQSSQPVKGTEGPDVR